VTQGGSTQLASPFQKENYFLCHELPSPKAHFYKQCLCPLDSENIDINRE
jgi:hypothetical protein